MTSFLARTCGVVLVAFALVLAAGCPRVPSEPPDQIEITQEMRDACPTLTDEVLDGFILAISSLRRNGLSEEDAQQQWVTGCQNIPPDGNFQGDIAKCEACLPVIIEQVYAEADPESE